VHFLYDTITYLHALKSHYPNTMSKRTDALDRLKLLLNELFQFDTQDLDFGIYKILHHKKDDIRHFIDVHLVEKIETSIQGLSKAEDADMRQQLETLRNDAEIVWYKKMQAQDGAVPDAMLSPLVKEKISRLHDLERFNEKYASIDDSILIIYDHLFRFFSRYYDKGDFITQRRFGKKGKYVVEYNGEETLFHWANKDQYYIKSGEHFQNYAFKIPSLKSGSLLVRFCLTDAQTTQGNVKQDEQRFFILSAQKQPELSDEQFDIYFEYRPLSPDEKNALSGNDKQDLLNQQSAATLHPIFGKNAALAELWKVTNERTLLLTKLNHFTRKNQYDFFIHKRLKAFLEEELNYYIQSEMVRVEDLYTSESDLHFDTIRQSFRAIKVFKAIADSLIELLAQVEDFQKKLWEKKKFVLQTHWVITLDRLVRYIGEANATPFITEALANPAQMTDWRKDFGSDILPDKPALTDLFITEQADGLDFEGKNGLRRYRKLPIDTVHFTTDFTTRLLAALSDQIDLDDSTDGLLLHTDNYHGLRLLEYKYKEQVKCVYIDPPYNTGGDGFLYKDTFLHSSWSAMTEAHLNNVIPLLGDLSIFYTSIDDDEHSNYVKLVSNAFGADNLVANIIWQKKFSPQNDAKWFSDNHDFIIAAAKDKSLWRPTLLARSEASIERYTNPDDDYRGDWTSTGIDVKTYSAEYDYEVITPSGRIVNPPPGACWRYSKEKFQELVDDDRIWFGENGDNVPRSKTFLSEVKAGITPLTVWTFKEVGHNQEATQEIKKLGIYNFKSPKPTRLLDRVFKLSTEADSLILDYFAGSGTTWHATQLLNREDEGSRKCLLVEQGDYVYTVILPRIKKVAYSFDWKEGKPKDGSMNGLGVFMKYQKLEQYEESLENIAFTAPYPEAQKQMVMDFDQYIPKYFLHMETRESHTLVNTAALQNPFDYRLRVWNKLDYDTQQPVDIAETFLYLAGLHLCKRYQLQLLERTYVIMLARTLTDTRVLVVLRDTTNWVKEQYEQETPVLRAELSKYRFDTLYVNHDAFLPGQPFKRIEEVFLEQMVPKT
jgi:adenine-specific DNA-methyltransferase